MGVSSLLFVYTLVHVCVGASSGPGLDAGVLLLLRRRMAGSSARVTTPCSLSDVQIYLFRPSVVCFKGVGGGLHGSFVST